MARNMKSDAVKQTEPAENLPAEEIADQETEQPEAEPVREAAETAGPEEEAKEPAGEPAARKPALKPGPRNEEKKQGRRKRGLPRAPRAHPDGVNNSTLHRELQERKEKFMHTQQQLGEKLRRLLAREIEEKEQKEKRRAAEILGVFSAHNFYANGFTPEELRTTLEDLGPTYVKIGQIMSSRVDLLPEAYCKELEKLRQNVKKLDPEVARAVIEQETGRKIDEIFSEFRDEPLGSASIGQVHYAVLKDGTKVVVKVQRPLIADMMRNDYVLLKKGARLINTVGEGDENAEDKIDLLAVIEEMEKVTEEELDFRVEAENTKFFKEHCIEDETKITCPTVFDELTTERIFTMTYVDGCSIGKKEKLKEQGCDFEELGRAIVENYLHQVLDVGTFHADPHQGNIMVSHGLPYWIDFGMIGRITDADVNILQSLILSLLDGDLETLVSSVMSMGAASPRTDRNKLMEDLDVMLGKYMNVTSISDLNLSVLLEEVVDLATRHHIALPGKYTMLVRSITTIEGVIEQLCPELNLFELISGKLMDRARKSFDIGQKLMSTGKEALEIGKKTAKLPILASDALNSMVKGRMKMNMELTGYEELANRAERTVTNVVLAMFSCVLFFGSCILALANIEPKTPDGMPLVAAGGIVFSLALGIFTIKKMIQKK